MRTYGTGSFKKRNWTRSDGTKKTKWRGYVYASDGKKCWGSGDTQKAAEQAAIKARDAHEVALRGETVERVPISVPQSPTLRSWFDTYNEHRKRQRRSDNTLSKYEDYANKWSSLDPLDGGGPLGPRPISEITIMELEVCVSVLFESFSQNTVRNLQAYLSGALKRAYNLGHTERNHAALLDPIKRRSKGMLQLTEAHFQSMCKAVEEDYPMLLAIVLGRYGLRISEVCGLTAEDLNGNMLTLSRQLDRVRTSGNHGPGDQPPPRGARRATKGTTLALCRLKSDAAARSIILTDIEATLIMRALDSAKQDCLWDAVEKKWRKGVLFICHAPNGRAQEAQRLRDRYKEVCQRINAPHHYHDLRSLFATSLADAKIPLKAISDALGHTTVAVTEMYVRGLRSSQGDVWRATSESVRLGLQAGSD